MLKKKNKKRALTKIMYLQGDPDQSIAFFTLCIQVIAQTLDNAKPKICKGGWQ
jgi:hypothetical protein